MERVEKTFKCWEIMGCDKKYCPVYRQLQAEPVHLERMTFYDEMVATFAHEIRSPLTAIGGFARRLIKNLREDNTNRETAEIILSEVTRLEKLANDLRYFTQPMNAELQLVQVCSILEYTLKLLEYEFQRSNIDVETYLIDNLPLVFANPDQLKQVFLNLVNNAIDAMSSQNGGKLIIKTTQVDDNIDIAIIDTGRGVSEECKNRIFEPFFTTKPDGTGLGLAICKRIINSHHGEVTIESEEGRGAQFIIRLPNARSYIFPLMERTSDVKGLPALTGVSASTIYECG